MNIDLNEIVCIIDRSGSMASIKQDAIGGFNTFLEAQKALPGAANLTLILFDTAYEVIVDNKNILQVEPLNDKTFVPRGSTALLDAIGRAITSIGERLSNTPEALRPAQVIVAILTDGEENSSLKYTNSRVAKMIKHQQEVYNWQFIFLAANQDAFATGGALNIPAANTANFAATRQGTQTAYETVNNLTASYRTSNSAPATVKTPTRAIGKR